MYRKSSGWQVAPEHDGRGFWGKIRLMNFNPETMTQKERYKIATGLVLPRPIAWVSTVDREGRPNLAPYSFFTVASTDPLTLLFCPQTTVGGRRKDTLQNIRETGEFVINIVDEDTAAAMNQTATGLPAGQSEFDHAGLTAVPGRCVAVPRVGEAPAAFECRLEREVAINEDHPGGGAVVFGRVLHIVVRDEILDDTYISLEKLRPIGRLMGSWYCHVTELFELIRR